MLHLLAVEHAGQLRAEEEYEAGNIAPDEHPNDGADRAIDLLVIKIIHAPREAVLRSFPQETADDGARDAVADTNVRVRHEAIDDQEQSRSDEQTDEGENGLPEPTADRGE